MAMRVGVVASYPPTVDGIATYTKNLADAFEASSDSEVVVVRAIRAKDGERRDRVRAELVAGDRESQRAALRLLNSCDVALIEHEFGSYGGKDGDEVLVIARNVRVPLVVTLHTVLAVPSPQQSAVIRVLAHCADRVVVMTQSAYRLAVEVYGLPPDKLALIPHGSNFTPQAPRRIVPNRLLTWGLLGPGKGVEWMIRALPSLRDLTPRVEYYVAGDLHPDVRRASGTAYRTSLEREAERLGVRDQLALDPGYHSDRNLLRLIGTAAVVVLPYESGDLVSSGVLVDALAAGRAVVASRFPHAIEALATGAGIAVPHRDPAALADAIRRLLSRPAELSAATLAAARAGQRLSWREVARGHRDLMRQVITRRRRNPSLPFRSPGS